MIRQKGKAIVNILEGEKEEEVSEYYKEDFLRIFYAL
jgi:hypothetical protein